MEEDDDGGGGGIVFDWHNRCCSEYGEEVVDVVDGKAAHKDREDDAAVDVHNDIKARKG